MTLFLSTYTNKVDKKGRVSVPSSFRAAVSTDLFQGVVLFPSYTNRCIEGCSMTHMERLNQSLEEHDTFSREQEDLATVIFAGSEPLSFDQDGRVLVPQRFIEHCGIGFAAIFVGCGNTFQIWEPKIFELYQKEARERIKSKHITLRSLKGRD